MKSVPNSIPSPKRDRSSSKGRAGWYPYYAGFSAGFADAVLDRYCTGKNTRVLDSWNGSGTTTSVAAGRGMESFGFDLNPVMTIVARARLLNKRERSCLMPLANTIVGLRRSDLSTEGGDALDSWFKCTSVATLRQIEQGIQQLLLGLPEWVPMESYMKTHDFSDLVGFFYIALFRTVRGFLSRFQSSNPTWMKLPPTNARRLDPSKSAICLSFLSNVQQMVQSLDADVLEKDGKVHIGIASSCKVPIEDESIDFILTSPPYCTRIDYAAATRVELAVLGVAEGEPFEALRRTLIGTPTVPREAPVWQPAWGAVCGEFLNTVKGHSSRASLTYYYKGHCQYFESMHASIQELNRCIKPGGHACLVVQDSFYKDVYIDLAAMCSEMASPMGLMLSDRRDFVQNRNFAQLNPKSKVYRTRTQATESVLILKKK